MCVPLELTSIELTDYEYTYVSLAAIVRVCSRPCLVVTKYAFPDKRFSLTAPPTVSPNTSPFSRRLYIFAVEQVLPLTQQTYASPGALLSAITRTHPQQ